ncbi:MAG: hypothetical protein QOI34_1149 [Verrucomicrobiota bacterium]
MHLTIGSHKAGSKVRVRPSQTTDRSGSKYAIGEINAYIAIRDELLAEAEESQTSAKLNSVSIANDFVENCLVPSRSPYQKQHLPEGDALRERSRCREIKLRIAKFREQIEDSL